MTEEGQKQEGMEQKSEEKKEAKPKKVNLVYGALLLHSAGKDINENNMKSVLSATGSSVDDAQIKALVAALDGVDIEGAISKAAMPVAAAVPMAAGGAASAEAKKEEEDSDENKEAKAEEAAAGLGSLFG